MAINGDLVQRAKSSMNRGRRLHTYLRDLRPKGREKEGAKEGERHFEITFAFKTMLALSMQICLAFFKKGVFVSSEMVTRFSKYYL